MESGSNYAVILATGALAGRLIVGSILILAGWLKLKAGSEWFFRQILAYELVKGKPARWLAKSLPWAEILCGLWLLFGLFLPLAAIVTFFLLWGFTAIIVLTLLRGKRVDCGCFGRSANFHTKQARLTIAYRNLGLIGLLFIVLRDNNEWSIDTWLGTQMLSLSFNDQAIVDLKVLLITSWLTLMLLMVGFQLWQMIQVYQTKHHAREN
jgi:uncharacterized membrane protein YphA (DoxX/SURF4 family)